MKSIFRRQTIRGLALAVLLIAPATTDAAEEAALSWPDLMSRRSAEYDYDIPAAGSYQLPIFQPATDGTVLGTNGQPVSLHSIMRGRIVVLSFIYTRCTDPKACMRATGVLSDLQRISRNDPGLAEKLLLVTLSFDPANDTPGVMARYGRVSLGYGKGADWLFLTTRNHEDLQPLLESYGQRVDKRKKPSATGPYQHPLRVYLIDQQKQIRNIYSYGLLDPRLVITDARTLLAERQNTGSADIPVGESSPLAKTRKSISR
jgi:cytochrome oxidase Cu insertion factor (SCO1/SenC/PrrC family)